MRKKYTFYTLKVWLTTLLASPVLLFILFACIERPGIERIIDISLIPVYFMLVLFTMVVSSVGWFIFWGMEWLAYTYLDDIQKIKASLFIGVQLIIIGTFAGVSLCFGVFTIDGIVLYILAPYCTVAGFSVWHYQLEPGSALATELPDDEITDIKPA